MSKVYDIAFKIAGKLSGGFGKSFESANKTVNGFNKQLSALNKDSAAMDGLIKLRQEVSANARGVIDATKKFNGMHAQSERLNAKTAELGRQYAAAKRSASAYERQISKCGVPTRELAQKFAQASQKAKALEAEFKAASKESTQFAVQTEKAKQALEKSRAVLDRNRSSLRELDTQMGTTGTHMKTLVERQNQLAKAADRARAAQAKLAKINERLSKAQGVQDKASEAKSSSTSALLGMGAAAVATVGAPVKQAMSFEDQRAELGKYTDQAEKVFAGIQDRMLKYAVSSEDMTAMVSAAFQAGIAKDSEEALKILDKQNQAVVAFGMTGEQVGEAWADIQSKLHMTTDQTAELFDITNQYSNTIGVKAADMFDIMQRGGGALAGMTKLNYKQIGALSASFRKASTSSEVASTSMLSFTNAMTAGSTASKSQKEGFDKIGVSAEKLAKTMVKSPEAAERAITDVLKRISKLSQDEQGAVIGQIFGTDAGVKGAVINLVNGIDMVKENFETIKDPVKYADSMFKEFQARADTTSNSLTIAGNAVKLVAGGIGTALLPSVRESAEAFVKSSEGVIKWVSENQTLILTAMKVGGAIFGSVAAFHALRLGMAFVVSPAVSLYKGFLNIQKAVLWARNSTMLATAATKTWAGVCKVATGAANLFKGALRLAGSALRGIGWLVSQALMLAWRGACLLTNGAIKVLTIGVKLLGGALKFMFMNPVGLAILVVMALVAAGVALYKNWDTVKAKVSELWGKFSEFIGNVQGKFVSAWSSAWGKVKSIFSGVFDSLVGIVKSPLNKVIGLINGAIGSINGISVDIPDWVPKFGGSTFGVNLPKIPQLAEGGIATRSTLANIGEGGEPEAVIPLSKLSSMLGSGVGMGGGITVNFAPVINVSGGSGDAYADMMRGLDEGRRQLEKDLRRILADQRRTSFA